MSSFRAFVIGALCVCLSCTDANLVPVLDGVGSVDNKLAVTGTFCTSSPDEVVFPVKLLIVIDQSASLQCTDPGNARLAALNQAGAALDPLPNLFFGVVGFASWSRVVDFTPDWSVAAAALAPSSGQGGPATDYQGALSTVLSVLEQDMLRSGPAQTARTRYVVLFVGDGMPEPRCRAGCDDGDTTPDSLYGVCNTTEPLADEDYVGMLSPCPEYNQPEQILQKVRDIKALGEYHGVGGLSLNTVFLFAPEDQIAAVCGDVSLFGYVREEAEPLLRAMAEEGEGTYRDVNTSQQIDFLDFQYESLEASYGVHELFGRNSNAASTDAGIVNDSDGDGLDDGLEFERELDRLSPDSDGDGFGDLLETRFAAHGFDALQATVPAAGCDNRRDRDGDGLSGCEESFLGTSPLVADSDGDRIPDGLELMMGMDPTRDDARSDQDLDGRVARAEIRSGTHPDVYDEPGVVAEQVRTTVQPVAALDNASGGSQCYDYAVENISLVPALSSVDQKGRNRVLIYAEEEPAGLSGARGRYRVACVEARYLGATFKAPASGRIEGLHRDRFVDLALFDPDQHCLPVGRDPTTRPAWAWDRP